MKIDNVSITVSDVAKAAAFYRDILLCPVDSSADGAAITIGSSRLFLTQGEEFAGVHHLAFGILPSEFERAHAWLAERVELLPVGGKDTFYGGTEWNSRSVYFLGPEGIILELIARDADAGAAEEGSGKPRMLSISEVGIGVDDVLDAVATLSRELNIPIFYNLSATFASLGSHDGLLIVVQRERLWFPNNVAPAARGPLRVGLEPVNGASVEFGSNISIVR
ncbi:hypothetical protein [Glutamicibacter sp.]|uniref:VOC family protein n=1 Tax=Glutamicibacter sp. TaxID=1931995 RepID=UPI0028BED07A|nr:hypothetical protein [Glutamicibacter sp.]